MMLIVCPLIASATIAPSNAMGMFKTTIAALRQSARKSSTMTPVSSAPNAPSSVRPEIARVTYGDWSNS